MKSWSMVLLFLLLLVFNGIGVYVMNWQVKNVPAKMSLAKFIFLYSTLMFCFIAPLNVIFYRMIYENYGQRMWTPRVLTLVSNIIASYFLTKWMLDEVPAKGNLVGAILAVIAGLFTIFWR